jgi:hypothetical protein
MRHSPALGRNAWLEAPVFGLGACHRTPQNVAQPARASSSARRLQWREASGICRGAVFSVGDVAERLKAAVC